MTLVCVPILVESVESALADARAARDAGADLVEFRLDAFFTGDGFHTGTPESHAEVNSILRLVADSALPSIVTCRPVLEGGHFDGSDAARIALFERLGTGPAVEGGSAKHAPPHRPPRFLDVELATYSRSENLKQKVNLAIDHPGQKRDLATSLILSSHDFHSRPPDLIRQLERMFVEPACRVVKVAYRARSLRDNLELLDIASASRTSDADGSGEGQGGVGKPIIALAMGPFGLMSRVLAPKFGGFLTFASLRRDSATAPGQPIIHDLLNLYRFRAINPSTRVYGIVGWPVEHSLSPHLHNAGFEAIGHDGVYLPMPIPPEFEHFKATVLAMLDHEHLDMAGLSVTMPHKEHLVRLATEEWEAGDGRWSLDALSTRCGAANTLVVERSPSGRIDRLRVMNTDGPAAADALAPCTQVVVLGAGGTARAVVTELLHRGVRVTIANRTESRARELAEQVAKATSLPVPDVIPLHPRTPPPQSLRADGLINCTNVGMAGTPQERKSPVSESWLDMLAGPRRVVECIYAPRETRLMALARARGMEAVPGLTVLTGQAALQFEAWTGASAPRSLFDRVATEAGDHRAADHGSA